MALISKKALATLLVSAALVFEQSALAAEGDEGTAGAAAGEQAAAQNGNGEAQGDLGQGLIYLGTLAVLLVALDNGGGGNGSTTTTSP